jgi:3-hydroxyisobutyrate dehydrogenase-like beta-hydroxyacid dehydrogenase
MKVGFVGLGQMGKPMAMNMLKSGAELVVSSLETRSFQEFQTKGAKATRDVAELGDADIIFLSLPNGKVVTEVLTGPKGILQNSKGGQVIVDTSTIAYATTMEISKRSEERGAAFMDAPVSGMEARAVDGTLTIMCGGERKIFDRIKPYLECVGSTILFMGAAGSGQLTKLVNQLLFDINTAAIAEVLPMAVKMGLDPAMVGTVVNNGTGKSYASDFFIPRILQNDFSSGYPMKEAYKDLVSAAEISANLCIPMPVLAAATTTYQMALLKGHGDRDKGGMIAVFEDLLGTQFRDGGRA